MRRGEKTARSMPNNIICMSTWAWLSLQAAELP